MMDKFDYTLVWVCLSFIVFFYTFMWRAFYVAEHPERFVPPVKPGPLGIRGHMVPPVRRTFQKTQQELPVVSSKFLRSTNILPLSIPLDPIREEELWSVQVLTTAGVPVIVAMLHETEAHEARIINIVDYREKRLMVTVHENLSIRAAETHFLGRLVEAERYESGELKYQLQEDSPKQRSSRVVVHIDSKGKHVHVLSGKQILATLERRTGTYGARRGEFIELQASEGIDVVLVLAIAMAFVVFVPPRPLPRVLPESTSAGPQTPSFDRRQDPALTGFTGPQTALTNQLPGAYGGRPAPTGR